MDNNSQKNFGDEDFIYAMGEQSEKPEYETNITDGYIIMGEEKIIFNRRFLLDKKFSIIMPEEFKLMSKANADIKYPSINRPDFIYTNDATTVNFSFTHRAEKASNEDIPTVKDVVQPLAMRMFPASKVIDSDTLDANGINVSFYDYIAPAIDMDIYTLVYMFSLEGRAVLGGCNCPGYEIDDWKPIFLQMLGSLELKK